MVFLQPEDYSDEKGDNISQSSYKIKTPKRIIQCSDGVLEEYSTDEEDEKQPENEVNPGTLSWGPWLYYKTSAAASSTLSAVEYVGENLAWFFGITSPRYYFELQEYKKRQQAEMTQAEKEKGWCDNNETVQIQGPIPNNSTASVLTNVEV